MSKLEKTPKRIKRRKKVKNWMAHTQVEGILESLRCPNCGANAENLVWKCCNIKIEDVVEMLKKQLEEEV